MPAPDPVIVAAAEFLAKLPPEERATAQGQLDTIVKLRAPVESLETPVPVRTLAEYLAVELAIPPLLIKPAVLVRGEVTATVGKSGKGKTTLNLHRMLRWAAGLPMFDELPDMLVPIDGKPLRVLAVENEGSGPMFQRKMRNLVGAEGFLPDELVPIAAENFLVWADGGYSSFKIDHDADYMLLRRAVEQFEPDVLLLEPFRGIWTGDENSNTEVGNVLGLMQTIAADFGIGVILAHHERKSGAGEGGDLMDAGRGASAFDGAVAAFENFRPTRGGGDFRELSWSKTRYVDEELLPVRMQYVPGVGIYKPVNVGNDLEERVLHALEDSPGLTFKGLAEYLGEEPSKRLRNALDRLRTDGRASAQQRPGRSELEWFAGGNDHGGIDV